MQTILRRAFSNETLVIDGNEYVECTFENCELIYAGGDFAWPNSSFQNCTTTLAGDALKTLRFMKLVGMLPN